MCTKKVRNNNTEKYGWLMRGALQNHHCLLNNIVISILLLFKIAIWNIVIALQVSDERDREEGEEEQNEDDSSSLQSSER